MKTGHIVSRRLIAGMVAIAAIATTLAVASPAQAKGGGIVPFSTIIGQEYEHANFGGAILSVTAGPNGFVCTGPITDVDATLATMPSGWNDVISSFRGFSNCWTKIFENTFSGASLGFTSDTSFVGAAMNDRTSSIQWS